MVGAASASRRLDEVRSFIGGLYGPDLHAKRSDALASATLGVMTGASLAVAMIGQALAQARGLVTRHAVNQVDRLTSNAGLDVWIISAVGATAAWRAPRYSGGSGLARLRSWRQSTLALSLVIGHGRVAPLIWLTVWKDEIATWRDDYEDACLRCLADIMPPSCHATILADRGFGHQKLFAFLLTLGFAYVLRFAAMSA